MMKWTLILAGLIIVTSLMSCKNQKEVIEPIKLKEKSTFERAEKILGTGSEVIPNASKDLFLCMMLESPRTIYCVVDSNMNYILKRKSTRGKVQWHNNTALLVENLPGVIQDNSSKKVDYTSIVELKKEQH